MIGFCRKTGKTILQTLNYLYKFCKVFLVIVGMIVFVPALTSLSRMAWNAVLGKPKAENHPSGDYKTIKAKTSRQFRAAQLVRPNNSGGEYVNENIDAMKLNIIKNVVHVVGRAYLPGQSVYSEYNCRCLGLRGRTILMLRHYIEHFKSMGVTEVEFLFYYPNKEGDMKFNIDDIEYHWDNNVGYGICILPKIKKPFRDIVSYMPSIDKGMSQSNDLELLEVSIDRSIHYHHVYAKVLQDPLIVPSTSSQTSWTIDQGYQYPWGGSGKCGTLLINPKSNCLLVGIHTAGRSRCREGYAEMLFRESFDRIESDIVMVRPQMDPVTERTTKLDGVYEEIGSLDRDLAISTSDQTKIIPSEIHGIFPVRTEPAPLSKEDPRLDEPLDILVVGTSKRCKPTLDFPKDHMDQAVEHYQDMIMNVMRPPRVELKPLTIKESIEGFAGEEFWEKLSMNTAEGYPWVKMRPAGHKDKKWMFDYVETSEGIKLRGIYNELFKTLEYKQQQREVSQVPCSYFTACLKDARILKEKVKIPGKTRIFEISPVDLTIAQRMYFRDYNVAYKKQRWRLENTIGINPDGPEWTKLAKTLTDFSPCILTADFSAFGPGLKHQTLSAVFRVRNNWYFENEDLPRDQRLKNLNIRRTMAVEIIKGLHVVRDLVFRPSCGLPSGNSDTVELNSEDNSLYMRVAFLGLAKKYAPQYEDLYWFDLKVKIFHNGDDFIASVKPDIVSWFNNETLIEFFAEYGIKMTDGAKTGIIVPYCNIESATYLKRGFLPHPTRLGQWLAPLEVSSITDTANWIWKGNDLREGSLINSEMALRLAYSHGPELYYALAEPIKLRWAELGVNFQYPSWISLDMHVWENTEAPKYSF